MQTSSASLVNPAMKDFLSTDDPRACAARDSNGSNGFGERRQRVESTWVKCKAGYAICQDIKLLRIRLGILIVIFCSLPPSGSI